MTGAGENDGGAEQRDAKRKRMVWDACQAVADRGEGVTWAAVRAYLLEVYGKAGSPNDLNPLVQQWKAERDRQRSEAASSERQADDARKEPEVREIQAIEDLPGIGRALSTLQDQVLMSIVSVRDRERERAQEQLSLIQTAAARQVAVERKAREDAVADGERRIAEIRADAEREIAAAAAQLETELASAEARNVDLQERLDAVTAERDALKEKDETTMAAVAAMGERIESLDAELKHAKDSHGDAVDRAQAAERDLKMALQEKAAAEAVAARVHSEIERLQADSKADLAKLQEECNQARVAAASAVASEKKMSDLVASLRDDVAHERRRVAHLEALIEAKPDGHHGAADVAPPPIQGVSEHGIAHP